MKPPRMKPPRIQPQDESPWNEISVYRATDRSQYVQRGMCQKVWMYTVTVQDLMNVKK